MRKLGRLVAARPLLVVVLALVVTLLALVPATKLHLATDLVALLPEGSGAARDYRIFLETFGGFEKIFVMIEAPRAAKADESGALLEVAEALAEKLRACADVAEVRSGLEAQDLAFFETFVVRRAALLLPDAAIAKLGDQLVPAAIDRRAAEIASALRAPGGGLRVALLINDPLGFSEQLPLFAQLGQALPLDPLTQTFVTPEGDLALLIVTPKSSEIDPASGRRLQAALDQAFAEVSKDHQLAMNFHAVGGPLYAAQDERIFREDLDATVSSSALACTLLLILVFGSLRIPLGALVGLLAALIWTVAIVALGWHELTAISLGFAAVLIGLGIDYGIHLGVRFRQLRFQGLERAAALEESFAATGAGLWSSALTTAVAFGVLSFAHFRPLREVGLVVALGIVAMLIGSLTLGAALWSRGGSDQYQGPPWLWRHLEIKINRAIDVASHRPRLTLLLTALLTLPAIFGLFRLELDPDLRALRPINHPAFAAEALLVERFALGLDTSTLVIRGQDLDDVLVKTERARQALLAAGLAPAEIAAPTDWLVPVQAAEARLAALARLPWAAAADRLEAALAANNLAPSAFAPGLTALRALGLGRDPGAPAQDDWPSGLAELVRPAADGTWAALRLRVAPTTWPEGPPAELLEELERIAPGAALASVKRIGQELRLLARRDLQELLLLALLAVAAVVLFSFRFRWASSLLALLPVTLGVVWAVGYWALLGRSFDLLALAVAPILLGIGIDDGLHAVHGARDGGLITAVRESGLAILLTSLTTILGFGSLIFSSVPGLKSAGALVSIGVAACFLVTLLVLPAWASWRGQR